MLKFNMGNLSASFQCLILIHVRVRRVSKAVSNLYFVPFEIKYSSLCYPNRNLAFFISINAGISTHFLCQTVFCSAKSFTCRVPAVLSPSACVVLRTDLPIACVCNKKARRFLKQLKWEDQDGLM